MLAVEGVTFRHGNDRPLLEDVDIAFERGASVALVGPSGCGKTTLLSLLGGLLSPQSGTVTLDRSSVSELRGRVVAWIPQVDALLRSRTAIDNAAILCRIDGASRDSANLRAEETASALGLGQSLLRRRARDLSGGEQQRVSVAKALACDRPLLLADEPTSQLDRHNASLVALALSSCASQMGRIVVVVTHDPIVAERFDRVVDMRSVTDR